MCSAKLKKIGDTRFLFFLKTTIVLQFGNFSKEKFIEKDLQTFTLNNFKNIIKIKSPSQVSLTRAVKDTVNIVAGGHLAVQLGGQNFGLPQYN
ncbi:hypothetical protein BpHYR1_009360 [Brachionus plicatilis]|uniref:Uncharacterized protein n=1 Tax=Brachionus plicatilis TaxID=10195 RepID=A0A3M7RLH0_BRAPC|nr:hypothetical protein BpHYR1_009360 [Brachionus plicatilis]